MKVLLAQKSATNVGVTIRKCNVNAKEISMTVKKDVAFVTSKASALRLDRRLESYNPRSKNTERHNHIRTINTRKFCSLIFNDRNSAKDGNPTLRSTGALATPSERTIKAKSSGCKARTRTWRRNLLIVVFCLNMK